MAIKTIPLSRLETDLKQTLNECADSGETVVVEMPDQRLLAIQSLDPQADDTLMDELLAANPGFQALSSKIEVQPAQAICRGQFASRKLASRKLPAARARPMREVS